MRHRSKAICVVSIAIGYSTPPAAPLRAQVPPKATSRYLVGAIDIHVHTFPDSRPRSIDAVDAARQAKANGMRAIVLKNHYEFTSGWAYLVRAAVPASQCSAAST